ncbi:hypothetical protein ACQJ25_27060, partial [Klebsiella pneumoniae]|uniref:hypothetical protein n=1 Tax=Klebsiella pneumoniae TaxID=573 RepID=UPI003D03971D
AHVFLSIFHVSFPLLFSEHSVVMIVHVIDLLDTARDSEGCRKNFFAKSTSVPIVATVVISAFFKCVITHLIHLVAHHVAEQLAKEKT